MSKGAQIARKASEGCDGGPLMVPNPAGGVVPGPGLEEATRVGSVRHTLGSLMCWTAVIQCAELAGVLNKSQATVMNSRITAEHWTEFLPPDAPRVDSKYELQKVPTGSFLGFFRYDDGHQRMELIHAMIYLGNGWAAGTKNQCIGLGSPNGWESVDLSQLQWGSRYSFRAGNRDILVRYRDLDSETFPLCNIQ